MFPFYVHLFQLLYILYIAIKLNWVMCKLLTRLYTEMLNIVSFEVMVVVLFMWHDCYVKYTYDVLNDKKDNIICG